MTAPWNTLPAKKRATPKLKKWQKHELCALKELKFQRAARTDMLAFAMYTKDNYNVGWHHSALCDKLNKFALGDIKRLIVTMPPRHGKSELVSRRLPAFIFGLRPDAKQILTSYSAELAAAMSRDVQRIMGEESYKRLFPLSKVGTAETVTKGHHFEVQGPGQLGTLRAAGAGGPITGQGGNFCFIDDPLKNAEEAGSATIREKIWEWYQSTFYTRVETEDLTGADGGILITMTRWHEDDLVGRLLAQAKTDPEADQWEVVDFPATLDAPCDILDAEGNPVDPRELGEPLWPEKYPVEKLARIKRAIGTRWWNALYQQKPSGSEGALIKRKWIKTWTAWPARLDNFTISVDASFKDAAKSDYVVLQVWARCGAEFYLLDQVRDRMDIVATIAALKNLIAKWPKAYIRLIEDKANGPAIISLLKKEVTGMIPIEPEGSKESRVSAVSSMFEAGNVLIPDPSIASWTNDWIEEVVSFPNAKHDDQVDCASQALSRMRSLAGGQFTEDMIPSTIKSIASAIGGQKSW